MPGEGDPAGRWGARVGGVSVPAPTATLIYCPGGREGAMGTGQDTSRRSMSPQHPPITETCSQGVSTAGEGGRGLLPPRGSVPEATSTHSQQPHVCQNDAGAKWDPLGGGRGGAAKALAQEVCLLRGFSHTTLPHTALTSGHHAGCRAWISSHSETTRGQRGHTLGLRGHK